MTRRPFAPALLALVLVVPARARAQEPATSGVGLPPGDARAAGFKPEVLDRIGAVLDREIAAGRLAGGSALVARKGKVVYAAARGLRDAEAKAPMAADTVFRIASMTKPVTSVAVMALVDDGKLRVSDPVSKYLPEFKDPKVVAGGPDGKPSTATALPAKHEVTVHELLTHTSGLTYRFFDRPVLGKLYADAGVSDGLVETPGTIGENVRRLAPLPLLHEPGTAWEYGLSTDVLGRLVEAVSGLTLDRFFHERVFAPLKMNDTYFVLPKEKRPRLAALYAPAGDANKTVRRVPEGPVRAGPLVYSATYPIWDASKYYSGGAGLVSTPGDFARFLQMLVNRGELDGARVLKPETVDLMTKNQIGGLAGGFFPHGERFGYGFGVVTEPAPGGKGPAPGSFSWGGIFYTFFWADPKRELIGVMMTQVFPSDHLKLREEFQRLVYEALDE
jgi:CubicO group peptidase (beta-lactamase class C family)